MAEFPSVGARARFVDALTKFGVSVGSSGQDCTVLAVGGDSRQIRFDNGTVIWCAASELSPLPAAPTIVEAK